MCQTMTWVFDCWVTLYVAFMKLTVQCHLNFTVQSDFLLSTCEYPVTFINEHSDISFIFFQSSSIDPVVNSSI